MSGRDVSKSIMNSLRMKSLKFNLLRFFKFEIKGGDLTLLTTAHFLLPKILSVQSMRSILTRIVWLIPMSMVYGLEEGDSVPQLKEPRVCFFYNMWKAGKVAGEGEDFLLLTRLIQSIQWTEMIYKLSLILAMISTAPSLEPIRKKILQ